MGLEVRPPTATLPRRRRRGTQQGSGAGIGTRAALLGSVCAAAVLALPACSRNRAEPSSAPPASSEAAGNESADPAPADDGDDAAAQTQTQAQARGEPPETGASIDWLDDEKRALARSARTGRPILIDFAAEWCAPCEEMERITFADPAVRTLVGGRLVPLKVDATEMDEATETLMKKYDVSQLPVILVRRPDGDDLIRFTDFVPPRRFVAELERALR